MHIHRRSLTAGGPNCPNQEAMTVIGSLQESELSPRVVVAVVGMPRENDAETKIVTRWLQQLLAEDRNHLPTPEELILEIDEAAGASQRADVGLEDAEVAAGIAL
jgi:hypothetical protein